MAELWKLATLVVVIAPLIFFGSEYLIGFLDPATTSKLTVIIDDGGIVESPVYAGSYTGDYKIIGRVLNNAEMQINNVILRADLYDLTDDTNQSISTVLVTVNKTGWAPYEFTFKGVPTDHEYNATVVIVNR